MFISHPNLVTPEDATAVWRYMNLSRFLSLLHSHTLYFSKRAQLQDQWEGQHYPSLKRKLQAVPPENREQLEYFYKQIADEAILNCWHENTHESVAMWKLYTDGADGVAIKSSIAGIKRAMANVSLPISIGRINYLDYDLGEDAPMNSNVEHFNVLEPLYCKRISFAHENEVRLLCGMPGVPARFRESHATPEVPVGTVVTAAMEPVNQKLVICLHCLIEEVVVSPSFPEHEVEALQHIVTGKLPNIRIKMSNLA